MRIPWNRPLASSPVAPFRVWLVEYPSHWRPMVWDDHPPCAVAFAPADPRPLDLEQASDWCRGFNQRELRDPTGLWAMFVRIGQEPARGQPLRISSLAPVNLN